jgi:precorrin-6B methylase 2
MATDISLIIKNLLGFYDFTNKVIVSVGAGGGQMVKYAESAKKVIAIDRDELAIEQLHRSIKALNLEDKFDVIKEDFYKVEAKGDVVLFEICLHEMTNPYEALQKARGMASDVVVYDHLPGKWSYYTAETEKIENGWKAIRKFAIRKEARFDAIQVFKTYDEIYEKLKVLGEPSLTRIEDFVAKKDFTIDMPYAMALI